MNPELITNRAKPPKKFILEYSSFEFFKLTIVFRRTDRAGRLPGIAPEK